MARANIENLNEVEVADLKERLGKGYSVRIQEMSAEDIVAEYAGWHLGDPSWGREFIAMYRRLSESTGA